MRLILLVLFIGINVTGLDALAGSFESYSWLNKFSMAGGYYQPNLKITYEYEAGGEEIPGILAIPRDANLSKLKLVFKVDGKKAEAEETRMVTWWSQGQEVPVYMPPAGKSVKADALFAVKNLFVLPPAPTDLPVAVKKLEFGFVPLPTFNFSGSFIGQQVKMKSKRFNAKEGEPTRGKVGLIKNAKANGGKQGLFYLIPRDFTFSFNLVRGKQQDTGSSQVAGSSSSGQFGAAPRANAGAVLGGIGTQAGTAGSGDADINTSDLKPYNMLFYTQKPTRDWQFAPTWLQQEYTYLPFGVLPGGRVKSRSLFAGAGEKTDDLIPWVATKKGRGDAAPTADGNAAPYQAIDLFVKDWRSSVTIDQDASRLVSTETKDQLSPAMANKILATEIHNRFNLKTAPALLTTYDAKLAPSLPVGLFHSLVTAVNIQGRWFFIDAAVPTWDLRSAGEHLKGNNALILAESLQMANF